MSELKIGDTVQVRKAVDVFRPLSECVVELEYVTIENDKQLAKYKALLKPEGK